jgi:hypothetical protein
LHLLNNNSTIIKNLGGQMVKPGFCNRTQFTTKSDALFWYKTKQDKSRVTRRRGAPKGQILQLCCKIWVKTLGANSAYQTIKLPVNPLSNNIKGVVTNG